MAHVTYNGNFAPLTLDGSVPSATNGLTLPAGTVQFVPATTSKGVTVLAGTAGAVVNILPLG
jgi:hypothetical protein